MLHKRYICGLGFVAALTLGASAAHAIEEPIKLGFLEVVSALDARVTSTGNLRLLNGEELNSELQLFKPRVSAFASTGATRLATVLEIHNGNYTAPGAQNFVDWKLQSSANTELTPQSHVKVRAEVFNTHEGMSNAFSRGGSTEATRFTTSSLNTSYQYGSDANRSRWVLDAGSFAKRFTDNEDTNAGAARPNEEDFNWSSTFHFRVLPGMHMHLQYGFKDVDYIEDALRPAAFVNAMDRQESHTYLGATWEATPHLIGKLRIASGYKEVAIAATRSAAHSNSWETQLRWEPLKNSLFTLKADHSIVQHDRSSYGLDSLNVKYNWEYSWSHQLKSTVAGTYSDNADLQSNRKEQGLGLKLHLDYAYTTWLNMFVAVGHDQRRSQHNGFNFSQQTVLFGIAASLERLLGR